MDKRRCSVTKSVPKRKSESAEDKARDEIQRWGVRDLASGMCRGGRSENEANVEWMGN
jgi:hypothetical protein